MPRLSARPQYLRLGQHDCSRWKRLNTSFWPARALRWTENEPEFSKLRRWRHQSHPKPPQGHPKATPRPPQGHPKATPRLPQGYPKAPPKPPSGDPQAIPVRGNSEIRRPKSEGNPKPEVRKKLLPVGMLPSGAGPGADFGFRASFVYPAGLCFGRVTVNSEP
jgi:hypothetical protein